MQQDTEQFYILHNIGCFHADIDFPPDKLAITSCQIYCFSLSNILVHIAHSSLRFHLIFSESALTFFLMMV